MTSALPEHVRELVERGNRKVHNGRYHLGGGTITTDGKSSAWGGGKVMVLVNPDGPALAQALTDACAEIERAYKDGFCEGFDHASNYSDDPTEAAKGAERGWNHRAALTKDNQHG